MASNAPARTQSGPARRSVFTRLDVNQCPSAHRGLLLDKFVEGQGQGEDNARQQLITAVCERSWSQQSDPLYAAAFQRWRTLWTIPGAVMITARTAAPLAIGHGAKGVIDGGVRLHRTYALPLIPGSSVRGALSAFVDQMLGQQHKELWAAGSRPGDAEKKPQGSYHRLLFGDTSLAGRLAFEDAWWVPQNSQPLRRDVITPHHQEYYTGNGTQRQEPAETDDPVPVTIPVVPQGSTFLFVVAWRSRPGDDPAEARKWLDLVQFLLPKMLDQQGLGAKRSQGYGRMETAKVVPGSPAPTGGGLSMPGQQWVNGLGKYRRQMAALFKEIDRLKTDLDALERGGDTGARVEFIQLLKQAHAALPKDFQAAAQTRPWMVEWIHS